jgi:hypothetical protein
MRQFVSHGQLVSGKFIVTATMTWDLPNLYSQRSEMFFTRNVATIFDILLSSENINSGIPVPRGL